MKGRLLPGARMSRPDGSRAEVPLLTYFRAIVIGLLQGVTELFPVPSLGHSRLVPTHETRRGASEGGRRLDTLDFKEAGAIGVAQIGALFAGISRSGITMVAGLVRGLDHEDAARFSFLLATPIIFAAGVYKLPDLAGHLGNGIRGQAVVGSLFALVAAYFAVRYLMRFFETRNLLPFAIYCLAVGAASIIRFT